MAKDIFQHNPAWELLGRTSKLFTEAKEYEEEINGY